jgi:hypothetical protein
MMPRRLMSWIIRPRQTGSAMLRRRDACRQLLAGLLLGVALMKWAAHVRRCRPHARPCLSRRSPWPRTSGRGRGLAQARAAHRWRLQAAASVSARARVSARSAVYW